jgi:hypothetical protein
MDRPAPRRADTRLIAADSRILLNRPAYDLRARDGVFICTILAAKAQEGIDTGVLELWNGPHGAYLRSADLRYPEESRPQSRVGSIAIAPRGAVADRVDSKRRSASGKVGSFRTYRVGGL